MTPEFLLPAFSLFTVAMAASVILSKNPVHSAFGLVLCFFGLAGMYLLWGATFLSVIQILIYAGAIVVLFVFVVMLLNLGKPTVSHFSWVLVCIAGISVWLLAFSVLRVLGKDPGPIAAKAFDMSVRATSKELFSRFLWPFEVLSVFLLVMIVAIFAIAKSDSHSTDDGILR